MPVSNNEKWTTLIKMGSEKISFPNLFSLITYVVISRWECTKVIGRR